MIVLIRYIVGVRSAELIRTARRRRGLTQAELARRATTTQTYVSRIERGAVEPTLATLERLLHSMGLRLELDVVDLSTGNEDPAVLRADFATSTPEARVEQAMVLSSFLTGVAADAAARGAPGGSD